MRAQWMIVGLGIALTGMPVTGVAEDAPVYPLSVSLPHRLAVPMPEVPANTETRLDQLARTYTTPKAIAAFLREEFRFQGDEELFGEIDHWQTPEEFVARQVGDCEDYALLAQTLLRRNGIEAYVVSIFGDGGYAHTVSVFVDERGRYNAINQDRLRTVHAKSLEALATHLYPGWTVAMIAEQDGTRGRSVAQRINPHPIPSLEELGDVASFNF